MKKNFEKIREFFPAIILSFILIFMLYIYEPILTYSANIDNFWFDFKMMIPNILIYSGTLFLTLTIIYLLIFCISKKISKKNIVFKTILIASYVITIFLYIMGNYLIKNLPILDGETINYNKFVTENLISLLIIILLAILEFISIKKYKYEKTIKINIYGIVAIFFMLSTSFISRLMVPGLFDEKINAMATTRNINDISNNKNFFIFVVDAVDSRIFSKVVSNNSKYNQTFTDFTYYPDTTTGYFFTRDAIPFLLSSEWNENERPFVEYYNDALNNSKLFSKLEKEKYEMNLYDEEMYWSSGKAKRFSNIDIYSNKLDKYVFFKQITKYVLYKYLPYPLKKYSKIETANFKLCKIDTSDSYFEWDNIATYSNLKNNSLNKIDNKYFQYIHIEGGHVPFDLDENLNKIPIEDGTYEKKLEATLKIIDSFIERLKNSDCYDNSVIVILADHGYGYNDKDSLRQNPILYIKGIDEHHEMITSDIPVSYVDLVEAYQELIDDKKSTELFENIESNRVRRVINNLYNQEIMIEWEQKGKAWDEKTFYETGKQFYLPENK